MPTKLPIVGPRHLAAGEEVVPGEARIARHDLGHHLVVVQQMRRHPTSHLNRQYREVDAGRSRTELGLQPRPPGIHRQQGELDLDAGLLLEGGRHLLDQGTLPRRAGSRRQRRASPACSAPGPFASRPPASRQPSLATNAVSSNQPWRSLPFFVVQPPGAQAADCCGVARDASQRTTIPHHTLLSCSSLANAIGNSASGAAHHPLTAPDDNPATRWR